MKSFRKQRLEKEIYRRVSEIVTFQMKDPLAAAGLVTRVELSNDLSIAKVFVSIHGSAQERKYTLEALNRGAGFVRGQLVSELRLRHHPELRFVLDKGMDNVVQVDRILNRLKKERTSEAAEGGEEE